MRPKRLSWAATLGVALLLPIAPPIASAYTVLAPGDSVAGQSIADWTAAWWSWAELASTEHAPISDPSGADANLNNGGPVFFVAGSDGVTPTTTRQFDVPAGRPLLVPLFNFFDTEPDLVPGATLADRQAAATTVVNDWLASVDTASLFASIDGNAVATPAQYLEVSGLFSMGPSLAGSVIEQQIGVPAGVLVEPTRSGGYWLMIDGLALGTHTLHFGGSSAAFTTDPNCCYNATISAYTQDNTLLITVVPEPSSALLIGPGLVLLMGVVRRSRRERLDT